MFDSALETAQRAIQALRRRAPSTGEAPPASSVPSEAPDIPPAIRKDLRNYAYVDWLRSAQRNALIVNCFVAAGLVVACYKAAHKRTMEIDAPPTLRQWADNFYRTDEVRIDHVGLVICSILPLLHHVDENGATFLPLLKGVVAPAIYREAEAQAMKGMGLARQFEASVNLNITSIDEVVDDKKTRRVSAFVRGYLVAAKQKPTQPELPRRIEYRAEVLLEINTIGNLNSLPYTLVRRTEKTGPDALKWERERAAKKNEEHAN